MELTQRQQMAASLECAMAADGRIVFCAGDIGVYAARHIFRRWPERALNLGVCEQASVAFCAGLSMSGWYPIYTTIDAFMVRRAYEFIRLDLFEQSLPALLISVGFDRDYLKLGPSHWCDEARDMMSFMPHIYEPQNPAEVAKCIVGAVTQRQLAYIRLSERNG